jgi:hypothetical protein
VSDERTLLARTAEIAAEYLETLDTRPVRPDADYAAMLRAVDLPLPEQGEDPLAVVEGLASVAEPGITAMGSGRYFGFVIGGALPASLAADWLVSAWDQNAGLARAKPSGTRWAIAPSSPVAPGPCRSGLRSAPSDGAA